MATSQFNSNGLSQKYGDVLQGSRSEFQGAEIRTLRRQIANLTALLQEEKLAAVAAKQDRELWYERARELLDKALTTNSGLSQEPPYSAFSNQPTTTVGFASADPNAIVVEGRKPLQPTSTKHIIESPSSTLEHQSNHEAQTQAPDRSRSALRSDEQKATDSSGKRVRVANVADDYGARNRRNGAKLVAKDLVLTTSIGSSGNSRAHNGRNEHYTKFQEASSFPNNIALPHRPGKRPRTQNETCMSYSKVNKWNLRCKCSYLPDYFFDLASTKPSLSTWPGDKATFLFHCKQIMGCRAHSIATRKTCREIYETEQPKFEVSDPLRLKMLIAANQIAGRTTSITI